MTRIQFSEKILQSHSRFEEYLESKEAIERIRKEARKPYVPGEGKLGSAQVAWVATTCLFRIYHGLFLQAVATIYYYAFSMRKEALDLYVQAARQDNYATMVLDNYLFTSYRNIPVDMLNTFSLDAREIYTHDPIDLAKISCDEEVLGHLQPYYINSHGCLIFDKARGQCAGISDWAAYLYFKTKNDFSDPEHHLVSVVKQVSDGAGREAALMQLAQIDSPPLLGLNKRCVGQLESPTKEKVQKLFKSLEPGLYAVATLKHRMNLAVTEDHMYLLQPNNGLIKETPEKLARDLAKNSVLKVCEITA